MRQRDEVLREVQGAHFDVCVIGGGATGAGCALDAQLRGLKTLLLEAGDFGGATSSASTKLVHGGVRYLHEAFANLDPGQYQVVKRALHERRAMLNNAPHLAHALEFVVPCYSLRDVIYYRAGLKLYDWIAGKRVLADSRVCHTAESLQLFPLLNSQGMHGSVAYTDGQFDDSRYVLALIDSFSNEGGRALNYGRVISLGEMGGQRVSHADVEDQLTQRRFRVFARALVNAAGPFADTVRRMANPSLPARLRPSKGSHIVLSMGADQIPINDALLVPRTEDGRVVFAIPWMGRLLVGTTDDSVSAAEDVSVTREDAEYLLRQANRYFSQSFTIHQVVGGFAGVRPLVSGGDSRRSDELIRDHEIEVEPQTGLISVLGGKWTTYRAMAQDAVDAAQRQLDLPLSPCLTGNYPLAGSQGWQPEYWEQLARSFSLREHTARHLASKFGNQAAAVARIAREQPQYAAELVPGLPPIAAEVVYCARNEMAVTIEDVLARRIGIQPCSWRGAFVAAEQVASVLGPELGWSADERERNLSEYRSKLQQAAALAGLHLDTMQI